jgi:hypothetical protein
LGSGGRGRPRNVDRLIDGARNTINRASVVGPGRLTSQEAEQIQRIANRYNTEIHVIGSRAAGGGRNIYTDLPVGKGDGTRSDIDMRIDGQANIDSRGDLSRRAADVGSGAGSPRDNLGLYPTAPPAIIFRPNQPPKFIPEGN